MVERLGVVAEHLVESVKHPDEKVVLHATDSLRRVANRSLMRARATRSAATQVDAMKPFVARRRAKAARGLVTSCVAQALHRFGDSRERWEPVLDVLETTYGDEGRGDGDATIAAEAERRPGGARRADGRRSIANPWPRETRTRISISAFPSSASSERCV